MFPSPSTSPCSLDFEKRWCLKEVFACVQPPKLQQIETERKGSGLSLCGGMFMLVMRSLRRYLKIVDVIKMLDLKRAMPRASGGTLINGKAIRAVIRRFQGCTYTEGMKSLDKNTKR